jgi:hypothetical protein
MREGSSSGSCDLLPRPLSLCSEGSSRQRSADGPVVHSATGHVNNAPVQDSCIHISNTAPAQDALDHVQIQIDALTRRDNHKPLPNNDEVPSSDVIPHHTEAGGSEHIMVDSDDTKKEIIPIKGSPTPSTPAEVPAHAPAMATSMGACLLPPIDPEMPRSSDSRILAGASTVSVHASLQNVNRCVPASGMGMLVKYAQTRRQICAFHTITWCMLHETVKCADFSEFFCVILQACGLGWVLLAQMMGKRHVCCRL